MWIEIGKGTLWIMGAVLLAWGLYQVGHAGGASQWAPPDAPRHADGTPDYPAIGRAYLAEAEADEDEAPDIGPHYCHVCLCEAREMDQAAGFVIAGEPRLCETHVERLGEWAYQQPGTLMAGLAGLREYAARTTEAGRE